jgi:hypothetical protein
MVGTYFLRNGTYLGTPFEQNSKKYLIGNGVTIEIGT